MRQLYCLKSLPAAETCEGGVVVVVLGKALNNENNMVIYQFSRQLSDSKTVIYCYSRT